MADSIVCFMQKNSWILVVLILLFGWTSPLLMIVAFTCMVFPVIFSFSNGRIWCGNFCPRGSFSGTVLTIISPRKMIPKWMRSAWFRGLILIILMSFFAYSILQPHPTLLCLGRTFIKMMLITTIMQITVSMLIHPYAWCSFCPMGTIARAMAKLRMQKTVPVRINPGCVSCNACTKACPMQIDIPAWRMTGEILDPDCLKCRKCVSSCPRKLLEY